MRIGELTSAMQGINTQSDVGVAMLSKSLDSMEITGDATVQMMDRMRLENSVNPNLGSNIDIMV